MFQEAHVSASSLAFLICRVPVQPVGYIQRLSLQDIVKKDEELAEIAAAEAEAAKKEPSKVGEGESSATGKDGSTLGEATSRKDIEGGKKKASGIREEDDEEELVCSHIHAQHMCRDCTRVPTQNLQVAGAFTVNCIAWQMKDFKSCSWTMLLTFPRISTTSEQHFIQGVAFCLRVY